MAAEFEVFLQGGAPWGFRLQGGKEFRAPLKIAKVTENGKADKAGIQTGDQVVAINGQVTQEMYHTQALASIKKATQTLSLFLQRPQTNDTTQPRKESTESAPSKTDMIRIETYVPPVLPSAPPVAPQPYEWEPQGESNEPDIIVTTSGYDSTEETETSPREVVKSTSSAEDQEDWSPDVITNITRTPEPISLTSDLGSSRRSSEDSLDNVYDTKEQREKKKVPQPPNNIRGFSKPKPAGRGSRRLTSSGSSIDERDLSKGDISNSFDLSYDSSVFSETSPAPKSYTPADTEPVHSDRLPAMRLLHANKDGRLAPSTMEILAGEGQEKYKTSSLPRSLGKRNKSSTDMEDRSKSLPRSKGKTNKTPQWYRDMYKEINKSMEGSSQLGRLLASDAKKGAFREYDGATSPRSVSPTGERDRRRRPKSIHIDKFNFEELSQTPKTTPGRILPFKSMQMERPYEQPQTQAEKREKRHSVHSGWYREVQKGAEIPLTGLSAESTQSKVYVYQQNGQSTNVPVGKAYQKSEKSYLPNGDTNNDPKKFEYNNPPDFLELRRKAEAEGKLREERERELRMIEQERRRWLQEEEENRKQEETELENRRRMEAERQRKIVEERKILMERQREEERRREYELERRRIEEDKRRREEELRKEEIRREEYRREQLRQEELRREEEKRREEAEKAKHMNGDLPEKFGRALYSFHPQSEAELPFRKGDVLKILREIDDNWYEGEFDGEIGIFPVNYVEILEPEPEPEPQVESLPEKSPPPVTVQLEEGLAKAKYSFRAESPKELGFKKNDMITLIRRIDENWYEGELGDRIGIFPVGYVEIITEPQIIEKGEERFIAEDVIAAPVLNHEVESAPSMIKLQTAPQSINNNMADYPALVDDYPVSPVFSSSDSQSPSSILSSPKLKGERNRAIFAYNPTNEDEVELREGDIIYVLEKCDDGWFVGTSERNGQFGTFPGNYVTPF